MTTASDNGPSVRFAENPVLPAFRRDLVVVPQSFRKRPSYVVKDPVSLKYFRIGRREYATARLLDGRHTLFETLQELQLAFPGENITREDLNQIVQSFIAMSFLELSSDVSIGVFRAMRERLRKMRERARLMAIFGSFVSFKISIFDPDVLLLKMTRRLKFLWTWQAAALLAAIMSCALWLILSNSHRLSEKAPNFFSPENIVFLWLIMILVKVVHEFGHGLSCKHFGGEVHDMGALFIVFTPFLYCDASDSWMLPGKWKRIIVNMAGIYLELFLASFAAIFWVLSEPGLLSTLAFNVMVICSVVTVFFNINPLMKFDGYFALADFMEIPNLKERSERTLIARITTWLTGFQFGGIDPVIRNVVGLVLLYAVLSYLWTIGIAYRLLLAVGHVVEPYGLDRLFQVGASVVLLGGVIVPVVKVGGSVYRVLQSERERPSTRNRFWRRFLGVLTVLAILLLWPAPVNLGTVCLIEGQNRVNVVASTPGFLMHLNVRYGATVKKGEELAVLDNPEAKLMAEREKARLAIAESLLAQSISSEALSAVPKWRGEKNTAVTALDEAQTRVDALTILAPVAGRIVEGARPSQVGVLFRAGDLIMEILPAGEIHALAAIDQTHIGLVRAGQPVKFRLKSDASRTFHGKVIRISHQASSELPHPAMATLAGGTVPTKAELSAAGALMAAEGMFLAEIAIENANDSLRPGMTGRARISCGSQAIGLQLWRWFRGHFRKDFGF